MKWFRKGRNRATSRGKLVKGSPLGKGARPLRYEPLEDRRMLAVVTVDTELDVVDFTDGVTSLREAIFATNTVPGSDEIVFDFGHDGPATITLTAGELQITDDLVITGSGVDLLTIDASGNDPTPNENNGDGSRVFNIEDGDRGKLTHVEIVGLALTGGDVRGAGGAILSRESLALVHASIYSNAATDNGGGINTLNSLSVRNSVVRDNIASFTGKIVSGGGIYSNGSVEIIDSSIRTNTTVGANSSGGGVYNSSGPVEIISSEFIGNSAGNSGGGYYGLRSDLFVSNSQFLGNVAEDRGGGIASFGNSTSAAGKGTAIIVESQFLNNRASHSGGGISSFGNLLSIVGSDITGNSTRSDGGGVYYRGEEYGRVVAPVSTESIMGDDRDSREAGFVIERSQIMGNKSQGSGGGVHAASYYDVHEIVVSNSTISGNTASYDGGGIQGSGRINFTVMNSTISQNSAAGQGGGVSMNTYTYNGGGRHVFAHSTIARNVAQGDGGQRDAGGGIHLPRSGVATLNHTIVASNVSRLGNADDISGYVFASHSLIGNSGGGFLSESSLETPDDYGNIIGGPINGPIDPLLGTLQDNGGATPTHALLPGSPAINAGDLNAVAGVGEVPLYDQRGEGFGRIFSRIDIGAFEVQELGDMNLLVDTLIDESDGDYSRGDLSLREAIELANSNPGHDTIGFDPSIIPPLVSPRLALARSSVSVSPQIQSVQSAQSAVVREGHLELALGELVISDDLTIIGPNQELGRIVIDASGNDPTPNSTLEDGDDTNDGDGSRVFLIDDSDADNLIEVDLRNLSLKGGDTRLDGGAIANHEDLSLYDVDVSFNISHSVSSLSGGRGGGIFNDGELLLVDSSLQNNSAAKLGGGVFSQGDKSSLIVLGSSLEGNTANEGGAVYLQTGIEADRFLLSDSSFSSNSSSEGGAILARTQGTNELVINSIIVSQNIGTRRGSGISVYLSDDSKAIIRSSNIFSNGDALLGGGVYIAGSYQSSTVIENTQVSSNSATFGGGISVSLSPDAKLLIQSSTINSNDARLGGGIYVSGRRTGELIVQNSTISGNESEETGGGINLNLFSPKPVLISHSTITDNVSDTSNSGEGAGGGIFSRVGLLTLDHTIVAGNVDNSGTAHDVAGVFSSNYSLVGFGGEHLGPLQNNGGPTPTHELLPGSPAIDAGDSALQQGDATLPEFDQRGAPFARVAGERIDIGAFESQSAFGQLTGDFDRNDIVSGSDFMAWIRGYGAEEAPVGNGDMTGNGVVDGNDFAVWHATYREGNVTGGPPIYPEPRVVAPNVFDEGNVIDSIELRESTLVSGSTVVDSQSTSFGEAAAISEQGSITLAPEAVDQVLEKRHDSRENVGARRGSSILEATEARGAGLEDHLFAELASETSPLDYHDSDSELDDLDDGWEKLGHLPFDAVFKSL